jgi:hypothetical protein
VLETEDDAVSPAHSQLCGIFNSNTGFSWHRTIDTPLYYPNLDEELKEWSNVLDVAFSHNVTKTPSSGYTEMVYGDGAQPIRYSAVGVGTTLSTSTTTSAASTTTSASSGGSIPEWGQW